ncbi:alanine racemase [Microbacterium yannicii]|uniref:alanine racemase n=1 Tax=Microbacterium yannicii TaxID=671622 RepID=UPI0002E7100E|nr:alanine racemase [Microbacterium yannicii]
MSLDLLPLATSTAAAPNGSRTPARPWDDPHSYWDAMTRAVSAVSGPVAALHVDALRYNALDMVVRAGGVPIRVASKSVRVRAVLDAVLDLPGYRGILAFTLPEALWLATPREGARAHDDIVLGYPTADRAALAALAADETAAARITLMVDDLAQLDLIDAIAAPAARAEIRIAIDADASWRAPGLGHIGVLRSPVHEPGEVAALARAITARPGFRLVGLMMYEAQIAGQGDATGAGDAVIRWMQRRSAAELLDRRAAIVAGLRDIAPLEFVNGGGTGSLELTASDLAVTELTAGSGLLAGHLFDGYRVFDPAPAAAFALDVVRRPAPDVVTVLGGGWIASGPAVDSRQPAPVWPAGLRTAPREGAGEVQTPLRGEAARDLRVGDRVWFRHAKSGELAERVEHYHLVDSRSGANEASRTLPTYRGEGKAFL